MSEFLFPEEPQQIVELVPVTSWTVFKAER
jgi:hypothetical protein